ncbi:MAG: LysM peptidoglycan-binding domain-containing protein [Actinobacteria bacterium]|nr:LysM peptidoglycan-binding domain-containing protein [Actinomycetota bacterium]
MNSRRTAARFAAPAAFLVAATVAVLLVRSAISDTTAPLPAPVTTAAATTTTADTTPAATTAAEEPGTTTTTAGEGELYEIQAGDTLETIAAAHGTTVEQLLVLNPDVDPVALSIGQQIRVE